ncbi:hypothetical protein ABGB16_21155 [Micromonospora sp. B11E3]|uniref:hypothetical protein n=1 Tax=Micromonospora sp. B11E3 TaxID=3153562 RepID=UPI00325DF7F8
MSLRRPDGADRPADRSASDRLLDAARAGRPADDPLARLLAAAAAPARPGELAGEEAALAAFRAAPGPAPTRRPGRRRLTVGAFAWIGALAATATAGVAVAAVTLDRGEEPVPPPPPAPTEAPSPSPADSAVTPGGAGPGGAAPSAPGRPGTTSAGPGRPTDPGRSATAELSGLCRAYLEGPAGKREDLLDTPGYAPLLDAAGGAGNVEPFCHDLVPDVGPGPTPDAHPTRTTRPDAGTKDAGARNTDR